MTGMLVPTKQTELSTISRIVCRTGTKSFIARYAHAKERLNGYAMFHMVRERLGELLTFMFGIVLLLVLV